MKYISTTTTISQQFQISLSLSLSLSSLSLSQILYNPQILYNSQNPIQSRNRERTYNVCGLCGGMFSLLLHHTQQQVSISLSLSLPDPIYILLPNASIYLYSLTNYTSIHLYIYTSIHLYIYTSILYTIRKCAEIVYNAVSVLSSA
jgi:hypothetical protein